MSTKTIYKRIALVAVATLGAGLLSVAPASAVNIAAANASAVAQKAGTGDNGAGGVAGPANTVTVTVTIKNDANAANTHGAFITVAGADSKILSATAGSLTVATSGNSAIYAATAGAADAPQTQDVIISTPSVGSIVVNVYDSTTQAGTVYSSTANATATITVRAAAVAGSINTVTSTAVMNKAAIWSSSTETTSTSASATANTAGTPVFVTKVTLGQVSGAITTSTKVAVSLTGPGTLALSASDTDPLSSSIATGRSITSTVAATGEIFTVGIAPDGVAGTSVLTITAGTYTATKTVTFSGVVASLAYTPVIRSIVDTADGVVTGDTDAYAAFITGKDAAGNAVTLVFGDFTAPTAAQLTAAEITNAAVVAATAATYSGVAVAADAPVLVIDPTATKTGAKTITLTHTATGVTVAVPFTVGLAQAATVTLTTDKAVYAPGEKMTLSITALGKDGIAIGDSGVASFFATGGIVSSVSINGDSLNVTAPAFVGGVETLALFAPLSAGPITFTATTSSAATAPTTAITVTGTATVENPEASAATDAANEATDAANAATDAALAAADAADAATAAAQDAADAVAALSTRVSTLISNLRKQITALTKLVQRLL